MNDHITNLQEENNSYAKDLSDAKEKEKELISTIEKMTLDI